MTFYEAAIEVLRRSGRPLHYKKITELAISENLLSHVGKTPEVTMSARLNQEVKRGEHASAILCKRPGIFALSDEVAERLNAEAAVREAAEAETRAAEEAARVEEAPAAGDEAEVSAEAPAEDGEAPRRGARRRRRRGGDSSAEAAPQEAAPAAEVEAAPQAEAAEAEGVEEDSEVEEDEEDGRGRGRRRRRRGRGRRRRDDQQEATSAEAVAEAAPVEKKPAAPVEPKPAAVEAAPAPTPERNGRKNERSGGGEGKKPEAQNNARKQERRPRQQPQQTQELADEHLNTGPVRLEGIAEAAFTVLRERADQSGVDIAALANTIFERKLVRFHTHDATMTVQAAMVNDNQLREGRGHRPLFVRYSPNRWGLSEWGLTAGMLAKEQQILSLSEECRQEAIALLGQKLLGVQAEALEHVTLTLLERLGYRNIKVSKRGADGDVFFSADWRQGLSDVRVCIQIVGDNTRTLDASAVTELRGTLHHYAASEGVIIHFGEIAQEAVQESREEKLATITLIDRATYVSLLVEQGIGVKRYHTPILVIDTSYVEALRGQEG